MSRRHSSRQDSLELLLDTICNTFGGVLFIAILVVLLLQQTGNGPASATTESISVSAEEMQSLTARMETVTDDLGRLQKNRDSQDVVARTFAPEEIRQLLATRSEVTNRQNALQAEVDKLLVQIATCVARVDTLATENQDVKKQLDESKARLQEAQSQLDKDRQSRTEEIRLPVVRESFKEEIGLVLRYGRMYVWHKYEDGNRRVGLNTDDFVVIGEEGGGLVTHPKPSAGIPLNETVTSQMAVRRILRQFDPQNCCLTVIARPDSYGVFRHVRNRALELGFEYRLMPVDENGPVCDRGGTGGQVQ